MKRARSVGFDSRSRDAKPLNAPRANFTAPCHPRQHPGNFETAEIFKQYQIKPPVLQICLRSQPQSPSVARRIQNPKHKCRALHRCLFSAFERNTNIDSTEFSERANSGKKIPAPSANLAVNPAREPRCLCVQPHSSSAHVQAFHPIGSAHTRRIQVNGFSVRKNHPRGFNRIRRQSQCRGQIVPSPCRQDSNGHAYVPGNSV